MASFTAHPCNYVYSSLKAVGTAPQPYKLHNFYHTLPSLLCSQLPAPSQTHAFLQSTKFPLRSNPYARTKPPPQTLPGCNYRHTTLHTPPHPLPPEPPPAPHSHTIPLEARLLKMHPSLITPFVEKCLLRTITSIAIRPKASLGQNLIKHDC